MRIRAREIFLSLLLLPVGSCSYFWFFEYPQEVQRETYGQYTIVASVKPTWLLDEGLIIGSTHNNTTVTVALHHSSTKIAEHTLVYGEDLPSDHLPVAVAWSASAVTVTEPMYGRSVTFRLSAVAPNNSFKPTPHRGVAYVHTLR